MGRIPIIRETCRRLVLGTSATATILVAASCVQVWAQDRPPTGENQVADGGKPIADRELPAERAAPEKGVSDLGDGRLVVIRLPLAGNADEHFKGVIQRAVSQLGKLPRRAGRRCRSGPWRVPSP